MFQEGSHLVEHSLLASRYTGEHVLPSPTLSLSPQPSVLLFQVAPQEPRLSVRFLLKALVKAFSPQRYFLLFPTGILGPMFT